MIVPDQSQQVATTDDGRYIVVNGRRWRATDPSIPDGLRAELVGELMAARRAVRDAETDDEIAASRRRVQDAKVALGERGTAWWETPDESSRQIRAAAALRTMLRKRNAEATVCPSDIARIIGGPHWREAMDSVRAVVAKLADTEEVEIRQGGQAVPAGTVTKGPIRIGRGRR